MKILAIESSAKAASVCITDDGKIIGEAFLNCGLTHSVTIMPSVEWLLGVCGLSVADIDRIAITEGPGSFTGLRIGMSAVKGLAWSLDIPCVAVSTLYAAANALSHIDGIICAVMDARAGQVYNANFRAEGGRLTRLCDDRALKIEELIGELCEEENIIVCGDGAEVLMKEAPANFRIAPEHIRYQRASAVALLAEDINPISAAELSPEYIRLPQAERERIEKLKKEGK